MQSVTGGGARLRLARKALNEAGITLFHHPANDKSES